MFYDILKQIETFRVTGQCAPAQWGGGIKESGDGEQNQRGEEEKKRKFGENITFDTTKS